MYIYIYMYTHICIYIYIYIYQHQGAENHHVTIHTVTAMKRSDTTAEAAAAYDGGCSVVVQIRGRR